MQTPLPQSVFPWTPIKCSHAITLSHDLVLFSPYHSSSSETDPICYLVRFLFLSLFCQSPSSMDINSTRIGTLILFPGWRSTRAGPTFSVSSISTCRSICPLSNWSLAQPCDLFWPMKCKPEYSVFLPGGWYTNYLPCKDEVVIEAHVMMVPPSPWVTGWQR